jgi:hypothetical protein
LISEELLDEEDELDVFVGVDPVPGPILCGLQMVELGFPVPEDILFEIGNLTDLADRVIELLYSE